MLLGWLRPCHVPSWPEPAEVISKVVFRTFASSQIKALIFSSLITGKCQRWSFRASQNSIGTTPRRRILHETSGNRSNLMKMEYASNSLYMLYRPRHLSDWSSKRKFIWRARRNGAKPCWPSRERKIGARRTLGER